MEFSKILGFDIFEVGLINIFWKYYSKTCFVTEILKNVLKNLILEIFHKMGILKSILWI